MFKHKQRETEKLQAAAALLAVLQAMDAAEAKRLADQQAWQDKRRAKYERAGGLSLEHKAEQDAR
jgi:hypothetical protein